MNSTEPNMMKGLFWKGYAERVDLQGPQDFQGFRRDTNSPVLNCRPITDNPLDSLVTTDPLFSRYAPYLGRRSCESELYCQILMTCVRIYFHWC